jgi:hypothetical protein
VKNARLAALALVVAVPLTPAGTSAQAAVSGSISGHVWLDVNGNGVRDADEPAIAGQWMYIDGTGTAVQSDANGHYEFTDLAAGRYTISSGDRTLSFGQGWTSAGEDSRFRDADGKVRQPVVLKDGEQVKDLDSAFSTGRVDYQAVGVQVSEQHPAVGDVIDIVGSVTQQGNVHDQFGGQLTLPEGLRVVERLGGLPKFYETEPAGKVTGYSDDRRRPGVPESLGVRVVVEKPLNGAKIKFEVWKGLFRNTDTAPANDVVTRTLTTS